MPHDHDHRAGAGHGAGGLGHDGRAPGKRTLTASIPARAGAPLPAAARERFESSLGADLAGVRVHTDEAAAASADALAARAYTARDDIYFGAGQYQPDDPFGLHLLAHEVAHTRQQDAGAAGPQCKLAASSPGDAAEDEADRAADAMVQGLPATVSGGLAPAIQRTPAAAPARRGKLSVAKVDETFLAWWKRSGNKPERIAEAEQKTRDQVGGGMPDGWVPPPVRNAGKTADASNYHPDETNSTQVPGPDLGPEPDGQTVVPVEDQVSVMPLDLGANEPVDGYVAEDELGQGSSVPAAADASGEPICEESAGAAASDGAPGATPAGPKSTLKMGVSPTTSPFGGALQFDTRGGAELHVKMKVPGLPEIKVDCLPAPVVFRLKPELSLNGKIKRDGVGNWDFEGTVELAGTASAELGVSYASAGVGVKLTGTFTPGGVHWDRATGLWSAKPVTFGLKLAPVVTATLGPIPFTSELRSYELLIVTLASHKPYVSFRRGPGVEQMLDDILSVLPEPDQRPLTPEQEAERTRIDAHSDTDDGATGGHG